MIEEVCRRVETASPSPVRNDQTEGKVTPIELSCLAPEGLKLPSPTLRKISATEGTLVAKPGI